MKYAYDLEKWEASAVCLKAAVVQTDVHVLQLELLTYPVQPGRLLSSPPLSVFFLMSAASHCVQ